MNKGDKRKGERMQKGQRKETRRNEEKQGKRDKEDCDCSQGCADSEKKEDARQAAQSDVEEIPGGRQH